jgi:hypothetical protein
VFTSGAPALKATLARRLAAAILVLLGSPAHAPAGPGEPEKPKLLVVAPQAFEAAIAPLIAHKNGTGMPAAFLSMEAVRNSDSPSGGNDAEKLKFAIAKHCLTGGRYVMLVGDMSLIPCCRRSVENLPGNPDAKIWHYGYVVSELFYENLFGTHLVNGDGPVSRGSDAVTYWDKNGNHLYNEQHWAGDPVSFNPDEVDGYPDIAVGRVPAHTVQDVERFVRKVIRYETRPSQTLNKATFFFGKSYGGSFGMSSDIAEHSGLKLAMPPDSVLMFGLTNRGVRDESGAPAGVTTANEALFDRALTRSLFLGYLGHGAATSWDGTLAAAGAEGLNLGINEKMIPRDLSNTGAWPIVMSVGCETGRHANNVPRDEYQDDHGVSHWFWWGDKTKNAQHRVVDIDTGQFYDDQVEVPKPSVYDLPKYQPRTFAYSWLCQSADTGSIAFMGEEVVCQNDLGRDLMTDVLAGYKPGSFDSDHRWHASGTQFVLGDLWLQGQRQFWKDWHAFEGDNSVFRNARIYLGIMNLYGDPSLRLPVLRE